MFEGASAFNQDISDWNVTSVTSISEEMFDGATRLSYSNKGLIHLSFSTNENWTYDWAEYVAADLTCGLVVWYPFRWKCFGYVWQWKPWYS